MHITCTICTSLFVAADVIVGTNCGHVFHHNCVLQWLERSKSCPTCRAKCNENHLCRIYFNIYNEPVEDASTLQSRIEGLEFKMLLKDKELKNIADEKEQYKKMLGGHKAEVKKLKSQIRTSETDFSVLREQITFLKKRNEDLESMSRECERLRKELACLRNVETVVKGSASDVDEMLYGFSSTSDSVKSLITFTSILKKEMEGTAAKKKQLSNKLRESESKVLFLTSQVKQLQEKMHSLKDENNQLSKNVDVQLVEQDKMKKKIMALEEAIASPNANHPCSGALKRLLAESPAPLAFKKMKNHGICEEEFVESPDPLPASAEDGSPYLKIKSSSIGLTPLRPGKGRVNEQGNKPSSDSNKFSIFKKPRLNILNMHSSVCHNQDYDGMGGHSKADEFPRPIPHMKIKHLNKQATVSKMKLKDASNNLKMDSFLQK